jgi:hypothetical protein
VVSSRLIVPLTAYDKFTLGHPSVVPARLAHGLFNLTFTTDNPCFFHPLACTIRDERSAVSTDG